MSLVQHLHRPGPLRTWWSHHTPALTPFADQVAELAGGARPLSVPGAEHAAAVGGVVGRLVEWHIEPAPPYAAVLYGGQPADAALWPTHAELPPAQRQFAVMWRPTPQGWRRLMTAPAGGGLAREQLREIATAETTGALGQRVAAAGQVASLESAYRSGRPPVATSAAALADAEAIVESMAAVPARLDELCCGMVRGHAAPMFAQHWADGDVLVGPGRSGANGLLDVKTVGDRTLAGQAWVLPWLWQLLSYTALDAAADVWGIRAVGLLLPRQDATVIWPVRQLWEAVGLSPAGVAELAALLDDVRRLDAQAVRR